MIIIHYPTAYKALDRHVDSFNSRTSQSSQKLKTAAVAAAKEIIRIYGAHLLKNGTGILQSQNQLPSLRTNNKQLATLIKCSSRSVQRYIGKLRKADVITGKIHHGPNANYELWINPKILCISGDLAIKCELPLIEQPGLKRSIIPVKEPFFESQRTDRLLSYSRNSNNNILKNVSNENFFEKDSSRNTSGKTRKIAQGTNVIGDKSFSGNTSRNISGNTRKIAQGMDATGNTSSAGAAPVPQAEALVSQSSENEAIFNIYVNLFWLTAKNMLYKYTSITPRQEQTAKKLIKDLYLLKSNRHLENVHGMFIQRIKLAAEYVQKDPVKRYIPLPYIYFDPNNSKGFAGTEKWYWEGRKYKDYVDKELLVERLIRRYRNNDKLAPSERHSPLKIFNACEKRLSVFKDETLTDRFYKAILEHHGIQL